MADRASLVVEMRDSAPQSPRRFVPSNSRGIVRAIEPLSTRVVPVDAIWGFVADGETGEPAAVWVAKQQLELITTTQLRCAGVGRGLIRTRLRQGTAQRVHNGVFHLGTELMLPGTTELAAVLACGDSACVRRRSAAAQLGIATIRPADVEIVVVDCDRRSRPGISVERVATLADEDHGTFNGIPITSPARTIIDFASVATDDELERAIAEAYALKLVTESELLAALERNAYRAGVRAVKEELARVGGPQATKLEGERRMKGLLRRAGFTGWVSHERVAGFEADFFWPSHRLIVEVDGYPYHSHRYAFERDRRRDQAHIAAGYTVIRFTVRQIKGEPLRVAGVIGVAIGRAQMAA